MARFYGVLNGGRGDVSRLGHKSTGLTTYAASWAGAVRVSLYVNADGTDCARVELVEHRGEGTRAVLYDGPVNPERDGGAEACGEAAHGLADLAERCAPSINAAAAGGA